MDAEDLIKSGDLGAALSALQDKIRNNPESSKDRIFLFQLLSVQGTWDRALTQLNVAAELDPLALLMAQACRELLQSEGFREEVFQGGRSPLVFGEPEAWIAKLFQALQPAASGDGTAAMNIASEAFDSAPASPGKIDDQPFEWLSDADMRLGPCMEAIVNGKYYWIPFSNISEVKIQPPEDLRDLVWLPAEFTWRNEGEAVGFIPTRYPESTGDDQLALCRKTEWTDLGENYYIGKGQKVLSTEAEDYSLLQVRHISFDHPEAPAGSEHSEPV